MHCVICGDAGVGKSTLLQQLLHHMPGSAEATIGVSFMRYRTVAGQLDIWDTAGQEQYQPMLPLYFRRASAAVVVFDLACAASLAAVPRWVARVRQHAPDGVLIALVGTKCDLAPAAVAVEPQEWVTRLGLAGFWETSGLTGQGVEAPFAHLLAHGRSLASRGVALTGYHEEPRGCC
jgi:small GTP-binding protein